MGNRRVVVSVCRKHSLAGSSSLVDLVVPQEVIEFTKQRRKYQEEDYPVNTQVQPVKQVPIAFPD